MGVELHVHWSELACGALGFVWKCLMSYETLHWVSGLEVDLQKDSCTTRSVVMDFV